VRLDHLVLGGDEERLAGWLGGARLPVLVQPGAPAVRVVVLRGDAGEIVLRQG
jgi:hypothetical protein